MEIGVTLKVCEFESPDVYAQDCGEEDHLQIEVDEQSNGGEETELLDSGNKRQEPGVTREKRSESRRGSMEARIVCRRV